MLEFGEELNSFQGSFLSSAISISVLTSFLKMGIFLLLRI